MRALALFTVIFLTACPSGRDDRRGGGDPSDPSDPADPANPVNPNPINPNPNTPITPGRLPEDTRDHSTSGGSWTLLVYMVADNNLEPFALGDIAEMADVGSSANLNIIVQIDRAAGYTNDGVLGFPDFNGVKRLKIEAGRIEELEDLGELNMGEKGSISDFLAWGLMRFPADRVGLVLWDHGGAWPGFGGDESTSDHDVLNLAELKQGIDQGLRAGGRDQLAFIGFDACLMATYETALSLRTFAEYLLASEELEPGHGWDYRSLHKVKNDPTIAPRALLEELVHGFMQQAIEQQTSQDVTLSVTDLHEVASLSNSIADIADALKAKAASHGPELGQIRASVLEFGKAPDPSRSTNMVDLADLAARIAASDSSLASLKQNLDAALSRAVVAKENGPVTARAGGLSLYYPPQAAYYRADYDQVEGVDAWREFIKGYNQAGQNAGNAPQFTNADHVADVWYDGESVIVSGQLSEGAAENVSSASLIFGLYDAESQSAVVLGNQPAEVMADNSVQAAWDGSFLMISQNGQDAVGFYSVEITENRLATTIPFGYIAPNSMTVEYVLLTYVYDFNTGSEQTAYYLITEGGPGELLPEQGSQLYPLVIEVTSAGASWATSVSQPFDGGAPIDLSLQPVPSGTTVFLQLEVTNFGGQGDYVSFAGTM